MKIPTAQNAALRICSNLPLPLYMYIYCTCTHTFRTLTLQSHCGQFHSKVCRHREPSLEHVELDLQEELVPRDLLDEAAGVGRVELHPQVQSHGRRASDLAGDALVWV
jgi:hypothetical protein